MNSQTGSGSGNRILTAVGGVALAAGLAIGGLALVAVAGVWTNVWNFGTGFQILFNYVVPWGQIIAILCFLDAITIVVLARVLGASNGMRTMIWALVGTAAAFVGFYVPDSYRPSEEDNIPGIHDISTDTVNPPQFVDVLPLRADAPNTTEYGASPGMTPAELARLSSEAYPDLVPVSLQVPVSEAYERAFSAVDELGWDLVAAVPEDGRIEATDTTFWFRFKDDIVIRIRPAPGGGSIVDARSVSRVGGGDAGTNARRLRAFFERL